MTSVPITIDVVPAEGCAVVAVAGEVDLLTADQLRDALMSVVERYPVVVVDLAEVQFLSSTGLAALTLAHRVAVAAGNQLRLVATDRVTLRPLEITGMTTQIAVFGSTTDAVAGIDRPDPSEARG
jgi:anti-sigma B factor antagonist